MNINPLTWFQGATRKRELPVTGIAPTTRLEAYGINPAGNTAPDLSRMQAEKMEFFSAGAALGRLDWMKKSYPQAKKEIEILAAGIERLSTNQEFTPASLARLTPVEKDALLRVSALFPTPRSATNVVRKPIKNLTLWVNDGQEIYVYASGPNDLPAIGDQVTIDGMAAPDGVYVVSADGRKLTVKNGRITKIEVADAPAQNTAKQYEALKAAQVAREKKNEQSYEQILSMLKTALPILKPAAPANPLAAAIAQMKANPRPVESDALNELVARNLANRRAARNQS